MNIDEIDFSNLIPKSAPESAESDPIDESEEEIVQESNKPALVGAEEEEDEPPPWLPGESPIVCHHTCVCGRRWSHGLYKNCKCPNIVEVSPCWECVREKTAEATIQETQELNKGVGEFGLSGAEEVEAINRERLTCKGMTLEQVVEHIENLKKIETLYRVKQLTAHKIKRDLEEEEISNLLTDEEREAFRRKVKDMKKKPTPTDKQTKKRQSAIERAIASMAALPGMTREKAESIVLGGSKK